MKTVEYTYQLEQINAVAQQVLEQLDSKIVLFYGDMGSGKTTFINALLEVMQSEDVATSPTFSIVNEYHIPNDKVYHFDFYRIESIEDAYNFGVEEYLNSNHWLFIEWPERIESLLPEDAQVINITTDTNNRRALKFTTNKNNLTEQYA